MAFRAAGTDAAEHAIPLLPGVGAGIALGVGLEFVQLARMGWSAPGGLLVALPSIGRAAAGGAVVAGVMLLVDRLTGNHVGMGLGWLADNRHAIGVVVRHPFEPWIGPLGRRTYNDAERVQEHLFGVHHSTDDGGDAFRHAYASALYALRMMRDHDISPHRARSIVVDAGVAHERDTWARNTPAAHAMDVHNNAVGVAMVGDGRSATGSWLSDAQVQERVLDALRSGELVRLRPGQQELVPTTAADLPLPDGHE